MRVTAGRKNGVFNSITNTMQQIFDAIIDRHRREVAASLKAGGGAFDDWDVKQVDFLLFSIEGEGGNPLAVLIDRLTAGNVPSIAATIQNTFK